MNLPYRFHILFSWTALGLLLLAGPGQATTLSSTAHFAFASEQRTALGAKNASGSGYLLDVAADISSCISLGVKTSALGFQSRGEQSYRLGAGPAAYFHVHQFWDIHVAALIFHEIGNNTENIPTYEAKGRAIFFGWQHIYPVGASADFLVGGFLVENFQSRVEPAAILMSTSPLLDRDPRPLFDRGVEIALRFRL